MTVVSLPGSVVVVAVDPAPPSAVEVDDPVVVEAEPVAPESAPVLLVSVSPLATVVELLVEPGRSFEVDVVASTLLLGDEAAVVPAATVLDAAWAVEAGSAEPPPPQAVSAAVTSAAPRLALARNELEDEYMALFG